MRIRFLSSALALLGLVTAVGTAQAQAGTVAGRVTQEGGTTPIPGAQVQILSGTTRVAMGASSDDGSYRVGNVPAGTYTVVVSRIGFTQKRVDGVRVAAGATTSLNVSMQELAAQLNQVVTTGTRGAEPEKILDSPNAISVVTSERIAERPAASIVDHIKSVPGLSISNGGIVQANIVSRGFNNAFSTSMLMLQDYRFAGVPSLRVNVPFLFTGTGDDIDRIEVLQGPASALYGPNSGAGVLHVITKSPFNSKGSQITLDGGERSLARVGVRHAGTIGNTFGYKFSGEYFTAQDWEYTDPNELTPAEWGRTATGGLNPAVPAARQGVTKFRDYGLEKYSGEARFDYRPSDNTEAITTVGYSNVASATEITGTFGAAQIRNWSYLNLQQRFRHKKFFAQVFYNGSNAGNDNAGDDQGTFYLRTGIPVVDNSSVLVGQLQQGFSLGATKFTAGADYIATNPVTEGTIMGRNEDDDNITEMGGYLQFTRPLSEKLEFTGAVRGDMNSRIDGTQFSPRAAFVYKATPTQNWRLTYNRAFNSPASFSFFLDQYSGNTPAPGMPVQVFGNPPKTGWQYSRACTTAINGGLCMRSPYAAGEVDATGASSWAGFTAALPTIVAGLPLSSIGSEANRTALLGLLAGPVGTIVRGLRPTAAQVPSIMLNLATRQPVLNPATVKDLPPLGANFSNTFELGYKGVFNNNLRLAVDFWYQIRPADPATQLVNPGVVMVQTSLQTYLTTALTPAVGAPTATAVAASLAPLMAAIPQGAIAFNNPLYDQPYLVFTYQNAAGQIDVRGYDVALDYLFNDTFSMSATYSNLNRNVWNDAPNATAANPLTANAAKHRGTLTFRSDNQSTGRTAELRMRYTGPFPVNSGVYNSYNVGTAVRYDAVPENLFLDAGISLKLPIAANARWSLNGQNLLDRKTPSFIGVPAVGRMVTTRISYMF